MAEISTENSFDVIIIGGGPGGYVCAIKAAQLGLKVACVELRSTLGGTCLNVGCIPSKVLLDITERLVSAKHMVSAGIMTGEVKIDFAAMMKAKTDRVASLTTGIAGLFKKNKVTHINGLASFKSKTEIVVNGQVYTAKKFVIATGSEVTPLPGVTIDEKIVVSSTGALALDRIPERMVVIGAGVIGLELGSVYARLGTKVEVVEFLDRITPGMDMEVARNFKRILEKQGIAFRMEAKVTGVFVEGKTAKVSVEGVKTGEKTTLEAECVLVAIGRRAFTKGLNLEVAGVQLTERGVVKVDSHLRTTAENIYALGDVAPGPMLAHKAEDEGVAVAETLAGKAGHVNYDVIPGVVYTHPEVASVGKTEEELKAAGIEYNTGKFSMMANSRARAIDDVEGFVKILACKKTDRVLGCHIISKGAGDLIHEIATAMELFASAEDIARTCHAHPTLNEAIKEAALATSPDCGAKAIHS